MCCVHPGSCVQARSNFCMGRRGEACLASREAHPDRFVIRGVDTMHTANSSLLHALVHAAPSPCSKEDLRRTLESSRLLPLSHGHVDLKLESDTASSFSFVVCALYLCYVRSFGSSFVVWSFASLKPLSRLKTLSTETYSKWTPQVPSQ